MLIIKYKKGAKGGIKGANRGYTQVLLATSRNRIYFRRRSINLWFSSILNFNGLAMGILYYVWRFQPHT
ncbi:hypothetical protein [Cardinium endosymbiont of Tipula unca]|uniref:hypothetical protein n=1 Tax=Cardinium endosymbiont of Tipula unca TaxID=3066216 RepID=UPI0030CBF19D